MRLWGFGFHSDASEDEREHAYELQKDDCRSHSLIVWWLCRTRPSFVSIWWLCVPICKYRKVCASMVHRWDVFWEWGGEKWVLLLLQSVCVFSLCSVVLGEDKGRWCSRSDLWKIGKHV